MTVTNVQQQDARAVAIDAAIVAAIRLHAPEFEAAYLGDDIPLWLDCLLDRCTDAAECIADHIPCSPYRNPVGVASASNGRS
jgi:hypothetical protein